MMVGEIAFLPIKFGYSDQFWIIYCQISTIYMLKETNSQQKEGNKKGGMVFNPTVFVWTKKTLIRHRFKWSFALWLFSVKRQQFQKRQ